MRVGLVGAGGTGKSTLARLLAKGLNLTYRHSISREVFQERGLIESDQLNMTLDQLLELQTAILRKKAHQDKYHGRDSVFDRTPVDHLAYLLFRSCSIVPNETAEELELLVDSWMKDYDYVIFTPTYSWTFKAESDGFRQEGRAYRVLINSLIKGLLNHLNVPYIIAPDTDPNTCSEAILELIRVKERERACSQTAAGSDREATGAASKGATSQGQSPTKAKHD